MMPRMAFNGKVGDLGSKNESWTTYELSFIGQDLPKLREFVIDRCKRIGVEVLALVDSKHDAGWKVTARVKSAKGVV